MLFFVKGMRIRAGNRNLITLGISKVTHDEVVAEAQSCHDDLHNDALSFWDLWKIAGHSSERLAEAQDKLKVALKSAYGDIDKAYLELKKEEGADGEKKKMTADDMLELLLRFARQKQAQEQEVPGTRVS